MKQSKDKILYKLLSNKASTTTNTFHKFIYYDTFLKKYTVVISVNGKRWGNKKFTTLAGALQYRDELIDEIIESLD